MMRLSSIIAAMMASSITFATVRVVAGGHSNDSCVSDLSEIFNTQVMYLDVQPSINDGALRFVLCPNTIFRATANGRALLELFGRNVQILCGENGSSENNCVLDGVASSASKGAGVSGYQMVVSSPSSITATSSSGAIIPQIFLSGITFTNMKSMGDHDTLGDVSVRIESDAQVTFKDCNWIDNVGEFILQTNVLPPSELLEDLDHVNLENSKATRVSNSSDAAADNNNFLFRKRRRLSNQQNENFVGGIFGISRATKDLVASQVEVIFDTCSFKENNLLFGLISNSFGNLIVQNCQFEKNDMTYLPLELMTDFTFVIDSFYGSLQLQDNSFVENSITLSPVTVEFSKLDAKNNCFINNYRLDANKGCDTILEVDDGTLLGDTVELNANYKCIDQEGIATSNSRSRDCPSSSGGQFTLGSGSSSAPPSSIMTSSGRWCALCANLWIVLWLLK